MNLFIVLVIVLVIVGTLFLRSNTLESFTVAAGDVTKINQGIDETIACEKSKNNCVKKITNIAEFRKTLGYPNFSLPLYFKLLALRKAQSADLTSAQITSAITLGNYQTSLTPGPATSATTSTAKTTATTKTTTPTKTAIPASAPHKSPVPVAASSTVKASAVPAKSSPTQKVVEHMTMKAPKLNLKKANELAAKALGHSSLHKLVEHLTGTVSPVAKTPFLSLKTAKALAAKALGNPVPTTLATTPATTPTTTPATTPATTPIPAPAAHIPVPVNASKVPQTAKPAMGTKVLHPTAPVKVVEHATGTVSPPPVAANAPTPTSESAVTQETVNECKSMADELNTTIQTMQQTDQANYTAANTAWQSQFSGLNSTFQKNPAVWSSLCGTSATTCEPVQNFFTAKPQTYWGGNDISGGTSSGVDEPTCMRQCRARTDCDYYVWQNAQCWLKGAQANGMNSQYTSGFKSNGGYRVIPNYNLGNNNYWDATFQSVPSVGGKFYTQTVTDCQQQCTNDNSCDAFMWQTYSPPPTGPNQNCGHCWKFKFNPDSSCNSGIKNAVTSFAFTSNSPYVSSQIGAEPQMDQYTTPIDVPAIVCQDCRQYMSNDTLSNSSAALTQTNQCITNLQAQVGNAPTATATSNASTTPIPATTSSSTPATFSAPIATSETTMESGASLLSSTLLLELGGAGVVVCLCCCVLVVIVGVIMMRKK